MDGRNRATLRGDGWTEDRVAVSGRVIAQRTEETEMG